MITEEFRQRKREYAKQYRLRYPEKIAAGRKRFKEMYPERVKESGRKTYQRRKKHVAIITTAWRKRNKDKVRAYRLKWSRASKNRSKIVEFCMRYRARKLRSGAQDCSHHIAILHKQPFCHWCCDPLTQSNREIDHVVPLSRGGAHIPDNLVAVCQTCNRTKSSRLIGEWTWKEAA